MRIGIGYDIHRLRRNRPMILGGVNLDYFKGPDGHSDGDALIHAICDALLGAMAKGDIGMLFPDTDARYKNMPSTEFLKKVNCLLKEENFKICNLDCTIILQEPKIEPYRVKIIQSINEILGLPERRINLKAKTSERLGNIGKGRAFAAHAAVLITAR